MSGKTEVTSTLTHEDVSTLSVLGHQIMGNLSCNINDNGIPCRTDRLVAVQLMIKYLEIHGIVSIKPEEIPNDCN
jgi:hypothetical protein|tara:strand:+ start:600 stop:824 length:225 start_codon:yes stop_codon:yes gene_type:complete